jgi:hypothetical protein
MSGEHRVKALCEALAVSRSGYYTWLKSEEAPRARENRVLAEEIRQLHAQSRCTYGSPRMTMALRQRGLRIGRHRGGPADALGRPGGAPETPLPGVYHR